MAAVGPVTDHNIGTQSVLKAYGKNLSSPRTQHKSPHRRRSASTHKSPRRATYSTRSKSAPHSSRKRYSTRKRPNSPSGKMQLLRQPLAMQALMSGLKKRNMAALAGLFPNENSTTVGSKIKEFPVKSHPEFAIGLYGKEYNDDWRMLTEAEWTNFEIQQELMAEYTKDFKYSWPLLENPLVCRDGLFIEEGLVYINGSTISDENSQPLFDVTIRGQYSARRSNPRTYEKEIIPVHTQRNFNRAIQERTKGWKIHKMNPPKKAPCLYIRYV